LNEIGGGHHSRFCLIMFSDLDGTHPSIELPNDDHKKQISKKGINMLPLITVSKPPDCF
jgi:hypothetical protein